MNKDIVRNALICISKMKIEDTTHSIARDIVLEEYENQQHEIERLNNIIKAKDEGIKALTEDLCDTTKELEETKSNIKEAIRILNSARKHYDSEETNWAIERALKVLKNEQFKRKCKNIRNIDFIFKRHTKW